MRIKLENNGYIFFDKGLELDTNNKECLIIFSPNGCGKSSICKQFSCNQALVNGNTEYKTKILDDSYNLHEIDLKQSLLITSNYYNEYNSTHKLCNDFAIEKGFIWTTIEDINQIINENVNLDDLIKKLEYYVNFSKLSKDYINLDKDININKIKQKERNFNKEVTKHSQKIVDKIKIIEEILNYNLEDEFLVKYNGNYVKIEEKIKTTIKNEFFKDVHEKEYEFLYFLYKSNIDFFSSAKGNKKFANYINEDIEKEKNKLNEKINILKNKDELLELLRKLNKTSENLLNEINEKISNINLMFKNTILEWKVNIEKLESIDDELKYTYIKDNQVYEKMESSTGEEKILKLINYIIDNKKSESDIFIFDDVFSSLDLNHFNEFVYLLKKEFICKKIILTHNFDFFINLVNIFTDEASYYILDKDYNNSPLCFEIDNDSIKNLKKWTITINCDLNYDSNELIDPIIFLLYINFLRESLEKNLKIFSKDKTIEKNNVNVSKIIDLIDGIRHFREEKKISEIINIIISNDSFKETLEKLPIWNYIFKKYKDSESKIFNEIINMNIKWDEFISNFKNYKIIAYVAYKMFLGLKMRFTFEQKCFLENQDIKDEWIKIKTGNDFKNFCEKYNYEYEFLNKNLSSFNDNFLSHLNSLQWSKIVEMPIKKIKKALEIIQDEENYKK